MFCSKAYTASAILHNFLNFASSTASMCCYEQRSLLKARSHVVQYFHLMCGLVLQPFIFYPTFDVNS